MKCLIDGAVCQIEIVGIMVKHEDRITWQARKVSDGKCVAVKCYKDVGARDSEVACYDALLPLQGKHIPRLLDPQFILGREKLGRRFGLVLSWVGEDFGGNYLHLPTPVLLKARRLLAQMHQLGVAHGDVRPENMNYSFVSRNLFLYDFSHALTRDEAVDTATFRGACVQDLKDLDEEIEWSRSEQGRRLQYVY